MHSPTAAQLNYSSALEEGKVVRSNVPWYVVRVQPLPGFRLRVWFIDKTEGEIHLRWRIFGEAAGVFRSLQDVSLFESVSAEDGVITWPNGLDIAPDAAYEDIRRDGVQDEASFRRGQALSAEAAFRSSSAA